MIYRSPNIQRRSNYGIDRTFVRDARNILES